MPSTEAPSSTLTAAQARDDHYHVHCIAAKYDKPTLYLLYTHLQTKKKRRLKMPMRGLLVDMTKKDGTDNTTMVPTTPALYANLVNKHQLLKLVPATKVKGMIEKVRERVVRGETDGDAETVTGSSPREPIIEDVLQDQQQMPSVSGGAAQEHIEDVLQVDSRAEALEAEEEAFGAIKKSALPPLPVKSPVAASSFNSSSSPASLLAGPSSTGPKPHSSIDDDDDNYQPRASTNSRHIRRSSDAVALAVDISDVILINGVDKDKADLNKLTDQELEKVKKIMDVEFEKKRLKPGDPGFQYEVNKTFEAEEENDWDSDSSVSTKETAGPQQRHGTAATSNPASAVKNNQETIGELESDDEGAIEGEEDEIEEDIIEEDIAESLPTHSRASTGASSNLFRSLSPEPNALGTSTEAAPAKTGEEVVEEDEQSATAPAAFWWMKKDAKAEVSERALPTSMPHATSSVEMSQDQQQQQQQQQQQHLGRSHSHHSVFASPPSKSQLKQDSISKARSVSAVDQIPPPSTSASGSLSLSFTSTISSSSSGPTTTVPQSQSQPATTNTSSTSVNNPPLKQKLKGVEEIEVDERGVSPIYAAQFEGLSFSTPSLNPPSPPPEEISNSAEEMEKKRKRRLSVSSRDQTQLHADSLEEEVLRGVERTVDGLKGVGVGLGKLPAGVEVKGEGEKEQDGAGEKKEKVEEKGLKSSKSEEEMDAEIDDVLNLLDDDDDDVGGRPSVASRPLLTSRPLSIATPARIETDETKSSAPSAKVQSQPDVIKEEDVIEEDIIQEEIQADDFFDQPLPTPTLPSPWSTTSTHSTKDLPSPADSQNSSSDSPTKMAGSVGGFGTLLAPLPSLKSIGSNEGSLKPFDALKKPLGMSTNISAWGSEPSINQKDGQSNSTPSASIKPTDTDSSSAKPASNGMQSLSPDLPSSSSQQDIKEDDGMEEYTDDFGAGDTSSSVSAPLGSTKTPMNAASLMKQLRSTNSSEKNIENHSEAEEGYHYSDDFGLGDTASEVSAASGSGTVLSSKKASVTVGGRPPLSTPLRNGFVGENEKEEKDDDIIEEEIFIEEDDLSIEIDGGDDDNAELDLGDDDAF
ncbi:hypothetical protein HDV05_003431 [Chytridiales sp. JEL 0842]|nr:hypothetical protein HDV05_003431 [Chytridiales sp. JEL 0842]